MYSRSVGIEASWTRSELGSHCPYAVHREWNLVSPACLLARNRDQEYPAHTRSQRSPVLDICMDAEKFDIICDNLERMEVLRLGNWETEFERSCEKISTGSITRSTVRRTKRYRTRISRPASLYNPCEDAFLKADEPILESALCRAVFQCLSRLFEQCVDHKL